MVNDCGNIIFDKQTEKRQILIVFRKMLIWMNGGDQLFTEECRASEISASEPIAMLMANFAAAIGPGAGEDRDRRDIGLDAVGIHSMGGGLAGRYVLH